MGGAHEFVVDDQGARIVLRPAASSLPLVAVLLAVGGGAFVLCLRQPSDGGRTMGLVISGAFCAFLTPMVPLVILSKVVIDREAITLHRLRRWRYAWGDHLVVSYSGRGSVPMATAMPKALSIYPWLASASTKRMIVPVGIGMSSKGRPPRQLAEFERVLADAAQRFGAQPVEVVRRQWAPEESVR